MSWLFPTVTVCLCLLRTIREGQVAGRTATGHLFIFIYAFILNIYLADAFIQSDLMTNLCI